MRTAGKRGCYLFTYALGYSILGHEGRSGHGFQFANLSESHHRRFGVIPQVQALRLRVGGSDTDSLPRHGPYAGNMRVREIMNIAASTKMAYRVVTFVVAAWLTGSAGVAMAADRIALVIGNAEYTRFDDLNSPVRDAAAMANKLRNIGFSLVGRPSTRERQSERDDESAKRSSGYAGAVGFRPNRSGLLLGTRGVVQERQLAGARGRSQNSTPRGLADSCRRGGDDFEHLTEEGGLNIVVLDACRDYALESRRKTRTKGSQTTKGLVRMDSPSNAVIVYAAKEGHVAYDGEHGLSPFTEALLAKIDQPGKSMLRVLSETAFAVEEMTKNRPHGAQKPFLSETQLAGMNLDTVSFVPCPPRDSDCTAIARPTHTDPVRVPPPHEIAYENARNKGTIIAYYSVIEQYPGTSSSSMAQQEIDALIPAQFSRPPVGRNNVLEIAEIKWCLRQTGMASKVSQCCNKQFSIEGLQPPNPGLQLPMRRLSVQRG